MALGVCVGHRCPQRGRSPHPSRSPRCCSGGVELGIPASVWAFIKNSTLIKFSLSLRRAWLALIKAGLLLRADKPLVGRTRAGKAPVVSGMCHPACQPWLPSCGEGEGIKQLLEDISGKASLGVSRLASFLTITAAGWGSGGAQAPVLFWWTWPPSPQRELWAGMYFYFIFFLEITPGSTDGAACVGTENLGTLNVLVIFFSKPYLPLTFFCGHPGALRCTWR